ncbi:hypothetical protein CA833_09705 [Novosphingobium sp. KA1]|nr:hypothetical protein CA833_09705 [Novosphingobium sp. KA1]
MLDHVLQAPLAPLSQGLSDVGRKADTVQEKLRETMNFLHANGDDLETIKKRVKVIQGFVERLDDLEAGLASLAEASSRRDQCLLDTLGEVRDEARQARLNAARCWRWVFATLIATLVVSSADLIARFLVHMN